MLPVYNILVSLFAFAILRCIYLRYFHPLSSYPGPFLASFTNLWRFTSYFTGVQHLTLNALHARYGPIVRTGPNSLSFSTFPAFEAIYGFSNRGFVKGSFYDFGRDAVRKTGSIFTARTDAVHRDALRKVVGGGLTKEKTLAYEPVVAKHVDILLSKFANMRKATKSQVIDVADPIHRFTVDTIFEVVHGAPLSEHPVPAVNDSLLVDFRMIPKITFGVALLPWLNYLFTSRIGNAITRKPKYDSSGNLVGISRMIGQSQNLAFGSPSNSKTAVTQASVLQNFLQVPEDDSRRMAIGQAWAESFNLMFAGHGSTAAALTAILFELGTEKGKFWQERIRAEKGGGEEIAFDAVIKETLRLRPPFPSGFPREVSGGVEAVIPGIAAPLPIGTEVLVNLYVFGRAKAIWGVDVEDWKPERWLDVGRNGSKKTMNGEETMNHDDKHAQIEEHLRGTDGQFFVFGRGARACVGKDIAKMMLKKAVLGVLDTWTIRSVGELSGVNGFEMQYRECKIEFLERRR